MTDATITLAPGDRLTISGDAGISWTKKTPISSGIDGQALFGLNSHAYLGIVPPGGVTQYHTQCGSRIARESASFTALKGAGIEPLGFFFLSFPPTASQLANVTSLAANNASVCSRWCMDNERNWSISATTYVAALIQVYDAMKAGNPNAVLFTPEAAGLENPTGVGGLPFLKTILNSPDVQSRPDIVFTFHTYKNTSTDSALPEDHYNLHIKPVEKTIHGVLPNASIGVTECGWQTNTIGSWNYASPTDHANYVQRMLAIWRCVPGLKVGCFYTLWVSNQDWSFFNPDASPKPAVAACKKSAGLAHEALSARMYQDSGNWITVFDTATDQILQAWNPLGTGKLRVIATTDSGVVPVNVTTTATPFVLRGKFPEYAK